jgi:hypothetical protein
MARIVDDAGLIRAVMPVLRNVADYIVQKIWNENRELVRIIVYEAYQPVKYKRTGDFQNAWDTKAGSSGTKATGEFYYNWESMSVGYPSTNPNSEQFGRHASAIDNFDARPYLADIIYNGLAGPAFGSGNRDGAWARKRDVWKQLQKRVGKSKIAQWFEESLTSQGVQFNRHRGKIEYEK